MRQNASSIWEHCDPTYINMLDKLICDVSEDNGIPEPDKGKAIVLIRQLYKKLEPYSA